MPDIAIASGPPARPRFSLAVKTYFCLVLGLLVLSVPCVVSTLAISRAISLAWRVASIGWPVLVAALFWYCTRRCSSDKMHFHDGLLWITRSAMTGWMSMSFITVTTAVLTAFLGSVSIAVYGDLQRRRDYAPLKWGQMVSFFYRNRMRR